MTRIMKKYYTITVNDSSAVYGTATAESLGHHCLRKAMVEARSIARSNPGAEVEIEEVDANGVYPVHIAVVQHYGEVRYSAQAKVPAKVRKCLTGKDRAGYLQGKRIPIHGDGVYWLGWGGYLADSPTGVVYHLSEDELLAGGNAGVECAQLYGKELYKIY